MGPAMQRNTISGGARKREDRIDRGGAKLREEGRRMALLITILLMQVTISGVERYRGPLVSKFTVQELAKRLQPGCVK